MIGKKIKSLIDASGLKYLEVAKKLDITYQNLNRILNKDSVETRYLFEIAKILNVPVTAFFENELGLKSPIVDIEKLKKENEELKKKVDKLEAEKDNLNLLIEFIKNKNLLDGYAIENFDSAPKSKFRADGKISMDYLIDLMEKEKNKDGSLSAEKLELVKKKLKEEYERKTAKM